VPVLGILFTLASSSPYGFLVRHRSISVAKSSGDLSSTVYMPSMDPGILAITSPIRRATQHAGMTTAIFCFPSFHFRDNDGTFV